MRYGHVFIVTKRQLLGLAFCFPRLRRHFAEALPFRNPGSGFLPFPHTRSRLPGLGTKGARLMPPMKTVSSHKLGFVFWVLLFQLFVQGAAFSQSVLNYQGRVISGGTAFNGTGQFKFAIVSSDGLTFYWKNDGTTTAEAPVAAVSLPVNKGLFSVQLGDAAIANMGTINSTVLSNAGIKLRVWFNDGVTGFQKFEPDTELVGYRIGSQGANEGAGVTRQIFINYLYHNSGVGTELAAGGRRFIEGSFSKIQRIRYKIIARTRNAGGLGKGSKRTVAIYSLDQMNPSNVVTAGVFSKSYSLGRDLKARWDPVLQKTIEDEDAAVVDENLSIPCDPAKVYIIEVDGVDSLSSGGSGIAIGTIVLDVF